MSRLLLVLHTMQVVVVALEIVVSLVQAAVRQGAQATVGEVVAGLVVDKNYLVHNYGLPSIFGWQSFFRRWT